MFYQYHKEDLSELDTHCLNEHEWKWDYSNKDTNANKDMCAWDAEEN